MFSIMRSAVALLLASASLITAQDTQIPLVCQEGVQLIAIVGSNVANGTHSYGLTYSFVKHVMTAIPNSANFSVNYNRFHLKNESAMYFVPEVEEGVPELLQVLTNYTQACPNTPIVIHGYSEGAVVTMNLLCGASSGKFTPTKPLANALIQKNVIAVILYGDETRTANQSFNLGGCTANAPHLPRRNPQGCKAFAPVIESFCFPNDDDCCGTANTSAPWPYGINPHYLYPAGFDGKATKFALANYYKYKNISAPSSSSSSTSSKPTSSSSSSIISLNSTSTTPTTGPTGTGSTSSTKTTKSTTTKSTTTKSTTTKPTGSTSKAPKTTMYIQSSCSAGIDQCLESFAGHPQTATSFCSALSAGSTKATPFPSVCTASAYEAVYSSACNCLQFNPPSSTASAGMAAQITAGAMVKPAEVVPEYW